MSSQGWHLSWLPETAAQLDKLEAVGTVVEEHEDADDAETSAMIWSRSAPGLGSLSGLWSSLGSGPPVSLSIVMQNLPGSSHMCCGPQQPDPSHTQCACVG